MGRTGIIKKLVTVSMSAALLAGTAGLTSGCAASIPGTGSCELTVDNAHASATKPGYIDGKGKVKCVFNSGALTNLTITTKLQKKDSSGNFQDVSGSSSDTTKATAKSGVTYTGVSGFIPCQKGTFRAASRASGYLNGKYSGNSDWENGNAVTNPCG